MSLASPAGATLGTDVSRLLLTERRSRERLLDLAWVGDRPGLVA